MKTLEDMLKESTGGTRDEQDIFACQFNKVSNMLYKDYGVSSAHLSLIIRDILVRVSHGECILKEGLNNEL